MDSFNSVYLGKKYLCLIAMNSTSVLVWVYLNMDSCIQGGYDKEEKAAKAYDLAALKYWGTTTTTNFPVFTYILYYFSRFILFPLPHILDII